MPTLKRLWRRLPALVDYLNDVRPSAVLAAEPRYNAMAAWGLRRSRLHCRLVMSEHIQASTHASVANPWADRRVLPLLRRAYLAADAIVTASRGVANDLAAYAGIPRHRMAPDLLTKAQAPVDHPWFAAGEPPVVLGVGRLDPQKDFATLLRAFAALRSRRSARLVILGSGPGSAYAGTLQALATELGIADAVDLPGFVHNPLAFMSRAAALVLSSRYEGLGNALIEALACGTPVVSTDCPSGPREILDDGRFGPLVAVGDDAALANAIQQVLEHPPPTESLRARAQVFSVDRAAEAYLGLLFPPRL